MRNKWHTNKTKPKAYEDIIIITKSQEVFTDMVFLDDYNKKYLQDMDIDRFWEEQLVFWQYANKLFKKEIEIIKKGVNK